jgi:hypothetical protein
MVGVPADYSEEPPVVEMACEKPPWYASQDPDSGGAVQ